MRSRATGPRVPAWVKIVAGITVLNSWMLFELLVVNPCRLDRYMPLYRVGRFCPWDVAALALVIAGVAWSLRRPPSREGSNASR